jgi:hypothetical protein
MTATGPYWYGYVAGLKWAMRTIHARLRRVDEDAEPDLHAALTELFDEVAAHEGETTLGLDEAPDQPADQEP